MSNNAKFWSLAAVVLGLITWSTVESYRLVTTTQKMTEAQALEQRVLAKLDVVRARQLELARNTSAPSTGSTGRRTPTTAVAETVPQ